MIVPKGQITVGLRHWHARRPTEDARLALDAAVSAGRVTAAQAEGLWTDYVSRQVLFAEVLMSLGHLDAAALHAVLLRHERSALSLGEYLVEQRVISPAVLHEALELQAKLQCSMQSLLGRADVGDCDRRRKCWRRRLYEDETRLPDAGTVPRDASAPVCCARFSNHS